MFLVSADISVILMKPNDKKGMDLRLQSHKSGVIKIAKKKKERSPLKIYNAESYFKDDLTKKSLFKRAFFNAGAP